jgi:predicted acylesterase/phospholipase RssA
MIGVAFQGCACRAAFHAGVAACLADEGVRIGMTSGASSGSLVAVGVAAGRAPELPRIWRSFGGRSVVSLRRTLQNRSPFDMSFLVRDGLVRHFGPLDLRAGPIEALVVATRLRDLARLVFSSREEADLLEPMLGSCFLPVLYGRTVRVRGELMVDGGLRDNLPIEELARRGATEVLAVVTNADGHLLKSLRRRRWRPTLTDGRVALQVIAPRAPLALQSWDFDPDRIARAIDEGYAATRDVLGR